MSRTALALLFVAASPVVLSHPVQAQTAPAATQPETSGTPTTAGPAPDSPVATPADQADRGATPTSGQPDAERREGVTVYRPEFFAASRPATAQDMVNRLPGFQFSGGSSARGFAGTAGNVLIDGKRPASKSDSLSEFLARIPAGQVDRIEVIRGGAPGIDMQGLSVVANVIRKAGDAAQQTLTIGTNTFVQNGRTVPNLRYEVSRTVGDRTYELAVGRSSSTDDVVGPGRRIERDRLGRVTLDERAGTEGDGFGYNARGAVKSPLAGGEVRANASVSTSDFKSEDHFSRPGVITDSINGSESNSLEVGLNFTRPLTDSVSFEAVGLQKLGQSLSVSEFRTTGVTTLFTSEADSGESIARGVLRWKRSDTLAFEGGAEAAFNFREGATALQVNGAPVELPGSNVRVEERRGEGFVTATWRPRPSLGVEAGSRFESSTISQSGDSSLERSFFYPKPRLLLTWTPSPNDTLRLRLEREVGQLNFSDFVASANLTDRRVVAGNPELEPDKVTVAEITLERRFWTTGAISIAYSREQITDAIDRVPVFALSDTGETLVFDAPGNIGDGSQDEVDLDITLPLDRFRVPGGELKLGFEMVDSRVTDPTTGETRRISGQRPEDFRLEFRQDLPRAKLTYGGYYLDGFRETYFRFNEVSTLTLDRLTGAFVEYKPSPQTSLRAELFNVARFRFGRLREVYDGPRNTSPLLFTEDYETETEQQLRLRLRRIFG